MIYVDEMTVCMKSDHWHYNRSCHLVADSVKELHEFAGLLGLRMEWFQKWPHIPHYDLTEGMRWKAIRLGAIEIDRKKFAEIVKKYRLEKGKK